MSNLRDNLKRSFSEGFTVDKLYAADKYNAKILKEIDPNTDQDDEEDLDLNDPVDDLEDPSDQDTVSPEEDGTSDETPAETASDESPDDEPKKRPVPDEITPPIPITPIETPEQKVERLYIDSGEVNTDYSNTNESNIRLAKFKFDNAGIVLDKVLNEDDLNDGISVKDIENRLTPEQSDLYRMKNKELRKRYPLIDKREKMCLIHNAHIPFSKRDESYNSIEIDENQRKQAYEKLNAYLEKHFAQQWQDKAKFINFLKTIKINFSDKPAIRANLINSRMFINEDDSNIIPLDKVYSPTPKSIQELILDNNEDEKFTKSNIFRTLNSAFNQEVASSGSLYVIINKENLNLGDGTKPDESSEEDDKEEDDISPDEPSLDDDLEPPTDNDLEPPPEEDAELDPVGSDVEI